jgi:uncharacterized membrane protein YgcG
MRTGTIAILIASMAILSACTSQAPNTNTTAADISAANATGAAPAASPAFETNGNTAPTEPQASNPPAGDQSTYEYPTRTGYVTDSASVIDPANETDIVTALTNLEEQAKVRFYVITVPSVKGAPIADYADKLMAKWEVAAQNGGIVMVVAVQDRQWYILVDDKIKVSLSPQVIGAIGQGMVPFFSEEKYAEGIKKGVGRTIALLAKERGFVQQKVTRS